jgi:hypothetical protein
MDCPCLHMIKVPRKRMTDDNRSFAFVFRGGLGQPLHDLAEADVAAGNADFVWVHLDLRDAAAQAWLSRRPWPRDAVETVAAPIQWGRLFITPDLVYGHLRDFRDEPGAATLEAGSLSFGATRTLLVTGRRIPLLSVKELTTPGGSPYGPTCEPVRADHGISSELSMTSAKVCCSRPVNASVQWNRRCTSAGCAEIVGIRFRSGLLAGGGSHERTRLRNGFQTSSST